MNNYLLKLAHGLPVIKNPSNPPKNIELYASEVMVNGVVLFSMK